MLLLAHSARSGPDRVTHPPSLYVCFSPVEGCGSRSHVGRWPPSAPGIAFRGTYAYPGSTVGRWAAWSRRHQDAGRRQ